MIRLFFTKEKKLSSFDFWLSNNFPAPVYILLILVPKTKFRKYAQSLENEFWKRNIYNANKPVSYMCIRG